VDTGKWDETERVRLPPEPPWALRCFDLRSSGIFINKISNSVTSQQSQLNRGLLRRREFLSTAAVAVAGFAAGGLAGAAETVALPFANGERPLARFPQKRPLILVTTRPPQLETPFSVFNEGLLTPNDAFFVRYHLSQVPTSIDPEAFKLSVKGKVNSGLTLSLSELKTKFDPVEIVAVNQCSGNGRGFFNPRVAGGQLGNGAMGNARWKGVRLKDVLSKAGIAAGAKQVSFNGLDGPTTEKVPDFVKALEIDHALDEDTLLAYQMNGEDLPMLNGFPLRLIVPGHYGTYWVKHVNEITVVDEPFNGYWMDPAYRVPDNTCACVEAGAAAKKTRPITRYNVRSFLTSLADGEKATVGRALTVRGIAFDGGYGINEVLFSEDGGKTWREAQLGKDLGKYSFREWTAGFTPQRAGAYELKVKATNRIGQSQPMEALWNPAGYMRNVVETVRVTAA
jgi:DMSO/TMAO reductase YedYZ molybdopterin-dependent catalytic subunit